MIGLGPRPRPKCYSIRLLPSPPISTLSTAIATYSLQNATNNDAYISSHLTISCHLYHFLRLKMMLNIWVYILMITWNRHIANVCKRLGHGFQILRNVIPVNDMLTIYKTLIQPHIDYCITIWGYAPKCTSKEFNDYKIKYLDLLQISLDGTLAHGIF